MFPTSKRYESVAALGKERTSFPTIGFIFVLSRDVHRADNRNSKPRTSTGNTASTFRRSQPASVTPAVLVELGGVPSCKPPTYLLSFPVVEMFECER